MSEEIVNKVAQSQLVTLDLAPYYPGEALVSFDLKPFLFMGLIIKEKEFRQALLDTDWSVYRDKIVAVTCTADAIVPLWAYMLVASHLTGLARDIMLGDEQTARRQWVIQQLHGIDLASMQDKRVVVKGCGDKHIDAFAYLEITKILKPVVKSIMYGEPCSTVPVYKKS